MNGFFDVITPNDIFFALAGAFVLTYLLRKVISGYRFIGVYSNIKVDYDKRNLKGVLKGCYELFPRDIITFQGDTFKRGNYVQVQTLGNRTITGELVGANNENMICLITAKHIIAHELSHIMNITLLHAPRDENAGS